VITRQQEQLEELKLRLDNFIKHHPPVHACNGGGNRVSRAGLFRATAAIGAAGVVAGAAVSPGSQAFAQSKDRNFVGTGVPNGSGFDSKGRDSKRAPVFSEGVAGSGTHDGRTRGTSGTGSDVTAYAYSGGIGANGYGAPGRAGSGHGSSRACQSAPSRRVTERERME
jgi:hypothetical protein